MKRRSALLLVFLTCCQVLGFLLFCKGFLLKRVVIPEYSTCAHPHTSNPLPSCDNQLRRYKRVVWLLIDALRYDFMLWDDTLGLTPPIYRNKMSFIHGLLHKYPSNAKLYKFVADPPTSTMQRLKALTTGGLPTFIDISNNFNSYEILEDSLIRQVNKNGRNITFMGDDTWLGLYPRMLSKAFPYPSLNVKDIHTVDNGVLSQLFTELGNANADLLISHFLGVDHIGHTYGPSHWTMGEKLPQMDKMMKDVVEAVDNETLVLMFGDHGMTPTGDHGGETELETHAALLVYSKQPLFHPQQPIGQAVYQIDLVPSVSLLLGLPIPFSNLGMLIPELFLTPNGSYTDSYSGRVTHDLLNAFKTNAEQIYKYLITYAQYSEDFPQKSLSELVKKLGSVKLLHNMLSPEAGLEEMTAVADGYVTYMREVKEMCHQVWAKFDDKHILSGLLLVIVAVLASFVLLRSHWVNGALLFTVICALVCSVISSSLEDALVHLVYCTIALNLFISLQWAIKYFWFHFSLLNFLPQLESLLQPLPALALLMAFLHALSLLSNSFVLYEGDMIVFFIQTLIFCLAFRHLQIVANEEKGGLLLTLVPYVALSVCLRVSKQFYACRDLQYQDGCLDTTFIQPYITAAESLGTLVNIRLLLSSVIIVATPFVVSQAIARDSHSRALHGGMVLMIRYGLPLAGLCVAGFWYIQTLASSELSYWQHVILPWVVYGVCGVTLVMSAWYPVRHIASGVKSEPIAALVLIVMAMSVWVPLAMLLNDGLGVASGAIVIQAALSIHVLSKAESPVVVAVYWALLSSHSFFACGHTTTVTSLRVDCAFTGIHGEINRFNLPLAGLLVGLNTLGPQLLFNLVTPLLWLKTEPLNKNQSSLKFVLTIVAIHSLKLVVSMFAASLHRRHLMIWQVFTPRVLYEGAFQLLCNITLLLSMYRVDSLVYH